MAHWYVLVHCGLQGGGQMLFSQLGRSRDNWWYKAGMTLVQVSIHFGNNSTPPQLPAVLHRQLVRSSVVL
jgi:hypothetical protein